MQKGTTLIEVLLSLFLFSTCMLGSGFLILNSIRLSHLAFSYTQFVLAVHNLANLYLIHHQDKKALQNELNIWQGHLHQDIPDIKSMLKARENDLQCDFTYRDQTQSRLGKYAHFAINHDGQICFS